MHYGRCFTYDLTDAKMLRGAAQDVRKMVRKKVCSILFSAHENKQKYFVEIMYSLMILNIFVEVIQQVIECETGM